VGWTFGQEDPACSKRGSMNKNNMAKGIISGITAGIALQLVLYEMSLIGGITVAMPLVPVLVSASVSAYVLAKKVKMRIIGAAAGVVCATLFMITSPQYGLLAGQNFFVMETVYVVTASLISFGVVAAFDTGAANK
jgi:hypothetical protein